MSRDAGIDSEALSRSKQAIEAPKTIRACLIGGGRLMRLGLCELMHKHHVEVVEQYSDGQSMEGDETFDPQSVDVLVLILRGGSFSMIHQIRQALGDISDSAPLVILSERIGRGQVYAALRIGAKGYLDLDCGPEELLKAIRMAVRGKVHLSGDVAELLVSDVSAAFTPSSSSTRLPSVDLSKRETEIVQLLCEGLSSKEIARRLHLSAKTVENHRYNIYRKCDVDSIAGLMRYAIQHGMIAI